MNDRETAYAKINLALHVRGREAGGYHRLETLFAFAEDGDALEVTPADALSLEVHGSFAAALGRDEDNLVSSAALRLQARFGITVGAALRLDKRLPVASGIGGGSADAAAALRLLNRFWRLDASEAALAEIASGLGADVPACLLSRTARGEGRGDLLTPLDGSSLAGTPLLLVNPNVALSTAAVFARWDGRDLGALETGEPYDAARRGRNDLERPARGLVPQIEAVLERLSDEPGVDLVRMSGSGATCFALFDSHDRRDAVAERLARDHPGWWCLASALR